MTLRVAGCAQQATPQIEQAFSKTEGRTLAPVCHPPFARWISPVASVSAEGQRTLGRDGRSLKAHSTYPTLAPSGGHPSAICRTQGVHEVIEKVVCGVVAH